MVGEHDFLINYFPVENRVANVPRGQRATIAHLRLRLRATPSFRLRLR